MGLNSEMDNKAERVGHPMRIDVNTLFSSEKKLIAITPLQSALGYNS